MMTDLLNPHLLTYEDLTCSHGHSLHTSKAGPESTSPSWATPQDNVMDKPHNQPRKEPMSLAQASLSSIVKKLKTYFKSPYTTVYDQDGRPLTLLTADVEHFYAEQARVIAKTRQEREQAIARQAAADLMAGTRRKDN